MSRVRLNPVVFALLLLPAACGKVEEKASEKMAEAVIESAIKKGGASDAKVDLSSGGVKTTVTDKDGKQQTFELNNAKISEADVGLPFYPGTKPADGAATRITDENGTALTLSLTTKDSLDKVVAFYAPQIKKAAVGKQLVESSDDGEHLWIIPPAEGKQYGGMTVQVRRSGDTTEVQIIASQAKP